MEFADAGDLQHLLKAYLGFFEKLSKRGTFNYNRCCFQSLLDLGKIQF